MRRTASLRDLQVSAYTVPTDSPESDGTLEWEATTIVVVEASAEGATGVGYTYADVATAALIRDRLAPIVRAEDPTRVAAVWKAMVRSIRNLGRPGIASMAIAAVDVALWDLTARLLGAPLVTLLGQARDAVGLYGSGGFTSYDDQVLCGQLAGWAEAGFGRVKMKVGRDPAADRRRVALVRRTLGPGVELFVDANGAYSRKQALAQAEAFDEAQVTWFEEPVSSDDLSGLRLVRDRGPAGMNVAAGEYGYDLPYFRRMLEAEAVDVLQADATRCAGITGFLQVAALCASRGLCLSAHCAPALHLHAACAAPSVCHIEYFHDHVRIEQMLFDGVVRPTCGMLTPDRSRLGHGLALKRADAARYRVS